MVNKGPGRYSGQSPTATCGLIQSSTGSTDCEKISAGIVAGLRTIRPEAGERGVERKPARAVAETRRKKREEFVYSTISGLPGGMWEGRGANETILLTRKGPGKRPRHAPLGSHQE